jgi:hypothetical protein
VLYDSDPAGEELVYPTLWRMIVVAAGGDVCT